MATSKWFSDSELRCKCGCGGNKMEPSFLAKLETIRELYGPMRVNSAYRCPIYNAKVSKTGHDGPHTTGRAIDISVSTGGQREKLVSLGKGAGMTGFGPARTFVHLDDLPQTDKRPRPWMWLYG